MPENKDGLKPDAKGVKVVTREIIRDIKNEFVRARVRRKFNQAVRAMDRVDELAMKGPKKALKQAHRTVDAIVKLDELEAKGQ